MTVFGPIVTLSAALALGATPATAGGPGGSAEGAAGAAEPALAYVLLDGSPGRFERLRGQVVLVNFWATDCAACVQEMPLIAATHQRFRARGFETLAVAMSYDVPAEVARFARTRQLPFGVTVDTGGRIAQALGPVRFTPTTLLLDKRGRVAWRHVGQPDPAVLQRRIEALLGEPA